MNSDGLTPLHLAAKNGMTKTAQELLSLGANPNLQDNSGKTPLHYAAEFGKIGVLNALLGSNADVTVRDNNENIPLHLAALNNQSATLKALVSGNFINETVVNAKNKDFKTPLDIVRQSGFKLISEAQVKTLETKYFNKELKVGHLPRIEEGSELESVGSDAQEKMPPIKDAVPPSAAKNPWSVFSLLTCFKSATRD